MAAREPTVATVADLVTAAINAQFPTLDATRLNVPRFSLEQSATPVVVVVPSTKKLTRTSRDLCQRDMQVEIGLFQRIDPEPHADALTEDELIALGEELLEWWVDDQKQVVYQASGEDDVPVFCPAGRLSNDEPFDMGVRRADKSIRVIIELDFVVL